jgi:hypothetical protein
MPLRRRAAWLTLALGLAGCGTATTVKDRPVSALARGRAHAVQPTAGVQAPTAEVPVQNVSSSPVWDPNAHAPPLSEIRRELRLEYVAAHATSATYINPLPYVTCCGAWERTDQGVDATMPVGAPILAPSRVKVLGIEPDWYAGQPLVYFELLQGPQAGKVQYVAEEITDLARPGRFLQQGQPIARFAPSGTGIEYGWSTRSGITLARATTGAEGGAMTAAGMWMRAWLNSLGAGAGPNAH